VIEDLGADELIDHQTCDFAGVVGDLDVVLDSLGGEIARRSIGVLRPRPPGRSRLDVPCRWRRSSWASARYRRSLPSEDGRPASHCRY
jgi:Zinc-binding dehydrogenase